MQMPKEATKHWPNLCLSLAASSAITIPHLCCPAPPRQGNHPRSGNTVEELKHGRRPAVHGCLSVLTMFWAKEDNNTAHPSRLGLYAHTGFLEVLLLKHSPGHQEIPTISYQTHFRGNMSHLSIRGKWQQTISLIYIFQKKSKQKTWP